MTARDELTPASVLMRSDEPMAAEVGGEIVLMSVEQGLYFGLDPVAADIWRRMADPIAIGTLCAQLSEAYAGDAATIEADTLTLLSALHARGLIRLMPPADNRD